MNGKFILILFVCLNLSTLVASSVCLEMQNECKFGKNVILELFVPSSLLDETEAKENFLEKTNGVGFNEEFTSLAGDITKEQSGGTFLENAGFSFLDGLKMILGILSLLLPVPFITFIISVGFPLWITILLGLIPILLYIMAFIEFIRGSSF